MKILQTVNCLSLESALNGTTSFIDRNLRWIQNVPYVLLGVGCLIVGRRLKVLTQFKSISDIPHEFMKRNVSLRGCVTRVSHDGTIYVRHVPIIKFKKFQSIVKEGNRLDALPVKLLGLQCSEDELVKLQRELEKLQHTMIWFQLWSNDLQENSNMKSLHCLVSTPKWPFNRCLNVDLLNEGMAEFQPLPQNLMEQRKGLALAERLVKAQNSAIKKRRGIWYEPTKMQSYVASAKDGYAQIQPKQWGRNFASSLKNIPSSLTQWFKRKT